MFDSSLMRRLALLPLEICHGEARWRAARRDVTRRPPARSAAADADSGGMISERAVLRRVLLCAARRAIALPR